VGFSASFRGLVVLSGMARALGSGGGAVFSFSTGGAGLGVSEVRTLSVLVGWRGGSGMALTMVAWMVEEGELLSPQDLPLEWKT
jgi:hypothetical protein